MNKLLFTVVGSLALMSLGISCGTAHQSALTVKVVPEKGYIVPSAQDDVVFSIDVTGANIKNPQRVPLNLAVVLDRSSSMSGAKIEQARQAAMLLVDQLEAKDTFSLVVYNNEVKVLIPAQPVNNKEWIRRKIQSIQSGGSTALYGGVEAGSRQLRDYLDQERINRVILLSDGKANVGPKTPHELARLGQRLQQDGISVTTVGLGDDYNEDVMVSLAEASAANYYYVQDIETLPSIFEEELGYLQSVVARNIKIIIQLPEGVSPVEIEGYPDVTFRENRAELMLSEYYASQQRNILVRCRVPDTNKQKLELAQVQLEFRDEISGAQRGIESRGYVHITSDPQKSDASIDGNVAKLNSWFQNVRAREEALALADQGKSEQAALVLRRQIEQNTALPEIAKDERLLQDNDKLLFSAEELETKGRFDSRSRKSFQYDNYNQRNQKVQ
ncbi:MAG: VWA domain-containing protein [Verrucomicrobiota bacterium]